LLFLFIHISGATFGLHVSLSLELSLTIGELLLQCVDLKDQVLAMLLLRLVDQVAIISAKEEHKVVQCHFVLLDLLIPIFVLGFQFLNSLLQL